jgi:hypothetical protein
MISDIVIGTFDRSVEQDLRKQLNRMANPISVNYLLALRAPKDSKCETMEAEQPGPCARWEIMWPI